MAGTAADGKSFTGISATTAAFALKGGKYQLAVVNIGAGTVAVDQLGPDNSTWIAGVIAAITGSGAATADLPPGQYRINVNAAGNIAASLVGIPV